MLFFNIFFYMVNPLQPTEGNQTQPQNQASQPVVTPPQQEK
jgi:hypothetical protein|nr:MAG TPA: hypothetical protein [Bacteriophage sp.]